MTNPTKLTMLTTLALLTACATNDGGDPTTSPDANPGSDMVDELGCEAVSYCSTHSADDSKLAAPTERGGTIADGIYRLERGSSAVELLHFSGNRFNEIGNSFQNFSGTYITAEGNISFSYTKRCSVDGSDDTTLTWNDRPYFVADAETLLIGMADSNTGVSWYEYKRVPADQICTENSNVSCTVTNCSCAVVTDGFGTVTSGIKSCSSQ